MVDVPSPSISSEIEATLAQLDQLNQQGREVRSRYLRLLESSVAALGFGTSSLEAETGEPPRTERLGPVSRRASSPEPEPFVYLPQRTTPGGDFGPAVRRKLIAEALARGDGW